MAEEPDEEPLLELELVKRGIARNATLAFSSTVALRPMVRVQVVHQENIGDFLHL